MPAEAVRMVRVMAEGAYGAVECCRASWVAVVVLGTGIPTCTNEFSKEKRYFFGGFLLSGLLMLRSCVLCNHIWLWGEGCDLGGGLGSRDPRAGSEKQNAGVYDLSDRDLYHSFIHL